MKFYLSILAICLLSNISVAQNNSLEKVLELCKPYSTSEKLDVEATFSLVNNGKKEVVGNVVLKRKEDQLFLDQQGFTLLVNKEMMVHLNKKRKTIEVKSPDQALVASMFNSMNPAGYLVEADTIIEDTNYLSGSHFTVNFFASSAFTKQELYFNSKGELLRVELEKRNTDPYRSNEEVEVMYIEYQKADYSPLLEEQTFSTTYFFEDAQKFLPINSFKNYQIINLLNN